MEFFKKTALITGGGSGMGLSCAKLLLAPDANVLDFDLKAPSNDAYAVTDAQRHHRSSFTKPKRARKGSG
jgi:NAD(P)-dependent dehydrogenase (short-subunit alcohol dehydrogenase family)